MTEDILIAPGQPTHPYRVDELPLISKLAKAAHHRYRKKWAKRLAKKPVRLAYDFAYGTLNLGGNGKIVLNTASGERSSTFDARRQHYGSLYFTQPPSGYEPDVSSLLSSLLQGDVTFFDIGANWGYFTFYAASLKGFTGPIHSFEPAPATRADLDWLRGGFELTDRITVHDVALSDHRGTAEMAIHDQETGLNRITGSGVGREGEGRATVEIVRLDDLDVKPDVIKMDVEDHEFEALSGAERLLSSNKPSIIVESWLTPEKPERTLRALRLLEAHGYVLYQPSWCISEGSEKAIFPEIGAHTVGPKCRLALTPFFADQRFMLAEQLNVFACHADKIDTLIDQGFSRWRAEK